MGIIPLYMGWDKYGTLCCLELKALEGICAQIELFPPGIGNVESNAYPLVQRDWEL